MCRGKVLAQVVESTLVVWKDLGSSPTYACCVLLFYYWYLIIWMSM